MGKKWKKPSIGMLWGVNMCQKECSILFYCINENFQHLQIGQILERSRLDTDFQLYVSRV